MATSGIHFRRVCISRLSTPKVVINCLSTQASAKLYRSVSSDFHVDPSQSFSLFTTYILNSPCVCTTMELSMFLDNKWLFHTLKNGSRLRPIAKNLHLHAEIFSAHGSTYRNINSEDEGMSLKLSLAQNLSPILT